MKLKAIILRAPTWRVLSSSIPLTIGVYRHVVIAVNNNDEFLNLAAYHDPLAIYTRRVSPVTFLSKASVDSPLRLES